MGEIPLYIKMISLTVLLSLISTIIVTVLSVPNLLEQFIERGLIFSLLYIIIGPILQGIIFGGFSYIAVRIWDLGGFLRLLTIPVCGILFMISDVIVNYISGYEAVNVYPFAVIILTLLAGTLILCFSLLLRKGIVFVESRIGAPN